MAFETNRSYRYKVWIKQSEYDLAAARVSFTNGFYEWACFQSEQSAEKALKGIMVFCSYKPPKLHKLSILSKMVRRLRPDINATGMHMEMLQSLTFVSRYPFIVPGDNMTPHDFINVDNAQECITEAENMLVFIKSIVEK